jgi:two-component system OmpR family response regulator
VAARILIVDDEPYILRILAFKLRTAGYVALEAPSASAAMAILESAPVQCVILDVALGDGPDGFVFADRLREDPRFCRIPVLFLTARSLPGDMRRARELNAAGYVTKPFSLQEVIEAVGRLARP